MIYQAPNAFLSSSKMMVAGKLNLAQNAVYSEDTNNFYGTQIQLMQSDEVRTGAEALVRATHPELPSVKVTLSVTQRPRTSIFELEAVSTASDYTQAYLNAVMRKYLDVKKSMRADQGSHVSTAITEQLIKILGVPTGYLLNFLNAAGQLVTLKPDEMLRLRQGMKFFSQVPCGGSA